MASNFVRSLHGSVNTWSISCHVFFGEGPGHLDYLMLALGGYGKCVFLASIAITRHHRYEMWLKLTKFLGKPCNPCAIPQSSSREFALFVCVNPNRGSWMGCQWLLVSVPVLETQCRFRWGWIRSHSRNHIWKCSLLFSYRAKGRVRVFWVMTEKALFTLELGICYVVVRTILSLWRKCWHGSLKWQSAWLDLILGEFAVMPTTQKYIRSCFKVLRSNM